MYFIWYDSIFKHCPLLRPVPEWLKDLFTWACGRHCWVTTLATCSLLFAGRVWVSISPDGTGINPDQFQPVMIMPSSLPAMGWSWDPILDTYTKEIPDTLFLEKIWSPMGDLESCIECCLAGKWYLVMSQQWRVSKVWQSRKTQTWGPEGDAEPLDQPSWSHFASGLFLCERLLPFPACRFGLLFYW